MDVSVYCSFRCKWCHAPIMLDHERLGFPFGSAETRHLHARSIACACNSCRHVGTYSLFENSPHFDRHSRMTAGLPSGETMVLGSLKCGEDTCESELPLCVHWLPGTSEKNARATAKKWLWDGLECPNGHPVTKPSQIPGFAN